MVRDSDLCKQFRLLFRVGDVKNDECGTESPVVGGVESAKSVSSGVNRHRAAAQAHADNQYGSPAPGMIRIIRENFCIKHLGFSIHIIDMQVIGFFQPFQVRQKIIRYIGPQFRTQWMCDGIVTVWVGCRSARLIAFFAELLVLHVEKPGINGMQHAVVCSGV